MGEASRAAAGALATRSEETPPTRARPFVAGADFPTVRVGVLRRRFGAAPTLQRAHTLDSTDASTFFCVYRGGSPRPRRRITVMIGLCALLGTCLDLHPPME